MKVEKLKFDIPYSLLKWSALFWMTYDHVLKKIFHIDPADLLLFPGRFAFPIFTFMIACNLAQKDIYAKYLKRLAPFALLSIPVDLYYYPESHYLNIVVTFMASILLLFGLHKCQEIKNKYLKYAVIAYLLSLPIAIDPYVDYGMLGIWLLPALYLYIKKPSWPAFVLALLIPPLFMPSILYAVLIIPFVAILLLARPAPSAVRSAFKKTGWMYYAYFPFHKLVIALIA